MLDEHLAEPVVQLTERGIFVLEVVPVFGLVLWLPSELSYWTSVRSRLCHVVLRLRVEPVVLDSRVGSYAVCTSQRVQPCLPATHLLHLDRRCRSLHLAFVRDCCNEHKPS